MNASQASAPSTRRNFVRRIGNVAVAAGACLLANACGVVPTPALRQRVVRVTYLGNQWRDSPDYANEFVRNLNDLGWHDGRNLTIDWRYSNATEPWLPELAAEVVRPGPDLIVTDHTLLARAVKQLTSSIPIVNTSGDPVGVGLVTSLARPGGNVTGLSTALPQLLAKRLQVLKEAVPSVVRVGMLWNSTPAAVEQHAVANKAASALGITVVDFEVHRPEDVLTALDAALVQHMDALCVDRVPVTFARLADIVAFAERNRIVAIYPDRDWVLAGGRMAYGRDIRAYRRRVADYIDRVLRGASPADLPIEQPLYFEFVVNTRAAAALAVSIAPSTAAQVTEWVE